MLREEIKRLSEDLKSVFSLCPEVDTSMLHVFDHMSYMSRFLRDEDMLEAETLLYFLDQYPIWFLCGYSSIASQNIYPEDPETKALGKFEIFARIPLVNHILHGLYQLNLLFGNITESGTYIKVFQKRILVRPIDYFFLLVAYLYHDVGKSPSILEEFGFTEEEYRKSDHAFVSGRYLTSRRVELQSQGIRIPDSIFAKIYNPVVSHHQKPSDNLSLILKYVDQRAREWEAERFSGELLSLQTLEVQKREEAPSEETKWDIPDDLFRIFHTGLIAKLLPRKKEYRGVRQITYFHFPPNIYVASYHVQFLLKKVAENTGRIYPFLEDESEIYTVARQVIRKYRGLGFIKDEKFKKDLLCGWWYKVRTRKGVTFNFFGFPIDVGDQAVPDTFVVEVTPMTSEEIKKLKTLQSSRSRTSP